MKIWMSLSFVFCLALPALAKKKPVPTLPPVAQERMAQEYKVVHANIEKFRSLVKGNKTSATKKFLREHQDDIMNYLNAEVDGLHVLRYAIQNKHWGVAEELVKQGSNLNYLGADRKTALMAAAEKGNREMSSLLLSRGADPAPKDIQGQTAYDYAVRSGDKGLLTLFNKPQST